MSQTQKNDIKIKRKQSCWLTLSLLMLVPFHPALALSLQVGAGAGMTNWVFNRNSSGIRESIDVQPTPTINYEKKSNNKSLDLYLGASVWKSKYLTLKTQIEADLQKAKQHERYTTRFETYDITQSIDNTYAIVIQPTITLPHHWNIAFEGGATLNKFKTASSYNGGGYYGPTGNITKWNPGWIIGTSIENKVPFIDWLNWKISYELQKIKPFTLKTTDKALPDEPVGDYVIKNKYNLISQQVKFSLNINLKL